MKRFYKLSLGEQFSSGDGWDMLKCGRFHARAAHFQHTEIRFFIWPWQLVETIEPNPNCTRENCYCKEFEKGQP